ncbi:MAG: protein-L-isoaspartate(D-aspartate) O-methyltransferase [Opitutales bacterium]
MKMPDVQAMVDQQIAKRGVCDTKVLEAMRKIDRSLFVPSNERKRAFTDNPLPIGHEQTISQPYVVAAMTEALRVEATDRVLEIGTGSGYQTAILAELAQEVWTIEIVPSLGRESRALLEGLGYTNLHYRVGDGGGGWPEAAPFNKIIVTAAPANIPETLLDQLERDEGVLVIPVGSGRQELLRVRPRPGGFDKELLFGVRFVPMTGLASG